MQGPSFFNTWITPFVRLVFPRYCVECGSILSGSEEVLCMKCNAALPRTGFHLWPENKVEKLFWGKFSVGRASAYLRYTRGGDVARIVHKFKYGGRKDIGDFFGRMMAEEMKDSGFFDGVDCIVPVPLHPDRLKERGYNQALVLANGISKVTGIPIDTRSLVRVRPSASQTQKSPIGRTALLKDSFIVNDVNAFRGKHILLIDDIVTTSSTLTACADAFAGAADITFSFLTLAFADT